MQFRGGCSDDDRRRGGDCVDMCATRCANIFVTNTFDAGMLRACVRLKFSVVNFALKRVSDLLCKHGRDEFCALCSEACDWFHSLCKTCSSDAEMRQVISVQPLTHTSCAKSSGRRHTRNKGVLWWRSVVEAVVEAVLLCGCMSWRPWLW